MRTPTGRVDFDPAFSGGLYGASTTPRAGVAPASAGTAAVVSFPSGGVGGGQAFMEDGATKMAPMELRKGVSAIITGQSFVEEQLERRRLQNERRDSTPAAKISDGQVEPG